MSDYISTHSELISSNPEFKNIIDSIHSEHTFELRKITHEINNVLTLINSSMQIIESSHPEVHNFKYWNTTMGDIQYLINLMSEISALNNGAKLSLTPVDITQIMNNIIDSFNSYISKLEAKISFKFDIRNTIPNILADATKLKQVFINLIKNSCEAVEHSDSPTINITMFNDNGWINIIISDNGCGISPEQLDTIFSPLVSYKPNGNGLGLSISKKIVEAHGGSISVTSAVNEGTSFFVKLPV